MSKEKSVSNSIYYQTKDKNSALLLVADSGDAGRGVGPYKN